jgi:2-iminobutanoate/2-iminopropanoate deaminase
MTTLLPLNADAFEDFLGLAVSTYAAQNVAAGRWPERDAQGLAERETRQLLPEGLDTPGHFLYAIMDKAHAHPVGYLWYATLKRGSVSAAYVYQVLVKPGYRRQGHARAALRQLEPLARSAGHDSMALNVFAQNSAAKALYTSLGYAVTNVNMAKLLSKAEPPTQGEPMSRQIVYTPNAAKPPPTYSQAVKAAGLVFVSGTAPTDPATGAFKGTTIQEQTRQCLTNIQAILEAAGSSMDKIVSVTVVMADEDDFQGMNEEWLRWFPSQPPARQGAKLPARIPGLKVSIAAIAEA